MRPPVLAVVLLSLSSATLARAADPPPKHFGRDRLVDFEHARIELEVDVPKESVEGATELTFRGIADGTTSLEVDAVRFAISDVTIDGRAAKNDYDGKTLRVTLDPPVNAGESHVLRVAYSAHPRNGLYFVHGEGAHRERDQAWSQGETEENRSWFPVHDDPSERLSSETIITVAKPLEVVGNGPLVEVTDAPGGKRTFHHRMDFPHVPYLVSIAVGDWADQRDEWEGVELTYHAPKDRAADMSRTFAKTPRILAFLSKETGVKYPYPVYRQTAVSEYIYGGMENIAATTLTDQTLHDERAQPDYPSEGLVAHEAAHQWFGDYVTTKDWNDVWLNEGFATYYAALTMGELLGPEQLVVELDGMHQGAIGADAGDSRRPVVTNRWHDEADLFDGHAYAKGGSVLHALRRELGDAGYHAAIQAWLTRYGGKSASTTDFIGVIEDVTGHDVSHFFDQWIFGAGQPDLEMSWKWKDGDCAVTITQAQAKDDGEGLFDVPLDLQLLAKDGAATDKAVRLTRREETFHVPAATRPEAVLADPQGNLLRTLKIDRDDDEAAFVLQHAPLLLARFEAARELKAHGGLPEVLGPLSDVARHAPEWSLRREASSALELSGKEGTPVLLEVLRGDADSRVRTAAAGALKMHREPQARDALIAAMNGDSSYAVRAAAARSLGKWREPGVERALEAATAQHSHREEVLGGALDGLGEMRSTRLRAIAEKLVAPEQSYIVRQRAVSALGRVAKDAEEAPERRAVREELVDLLDDPSFRVRMGAADALVTAGDADALGDMRRVAASHWHELTRARMRDKIAALEKASSQSATTADLRRALDDERKKREELEDRVREIESKLPPKKKDGE